MKIVLGHRVTIKAAVHKWGGTSGYVTAVGNGTLTIELGSGTDIEVHNSWISKCESGPRTAEILQRLKAQKKKK